MTGTSLVLMKYTNSYELCWVPLGTACTKAQVSIWRFRYQVTWTLSKADTFLKRTVALVPRVSALERVDCNCKRRSQMNRDFSCVRNINCCYYTTKLLGGLIQKIHQSDRAIAGLIFSKYQTGSVRIRPEIELFKMADAEEIEVCKLSPRNTKQFLSRRRRPPIWAWFGHVKQSGKTRGSCWTRKRRSHYEQQLSFKILSKNPNPI